MPAILLLLPVALLVVGAALAWAVRRVIPHSGRVVAAFFAWASLVALVAVWAPQRSAFDLTVGELGAGIRLAVRLDAVSFAFGLFVLVPAALLVTLLRSPSPPLALLATAASLFMLEASGLILAALALGVTLISVAMLLQAGGEAKPMTTRLRDQAALLCLLAAAAAIYGRAGTDQYGAVPVSALTWPIFGLVAAAALLVSGIVPWKAWPASLAERLRPETAGPATVALFFTGFYLLVRMYQAGGGHYPNPVFNLVLAGIGVACALAATLRAQAAATRHGYLVESLPIAGGFALLALALGTPLGVAAAIATLATAGLLCALVPLVAVEEDVSGSVIVALLVSAGLPPAAIFGTRLLDIQAAIEANEVSGYFGIAAVAIWVIGIAAAARAVRLRPRTPTRAAAGAGRSGAPALAVGALLVTAGAGLGALQATVAIPAAATVLSFPSSALTGGVIATDAASGSWPAVALGGLLVLVVLALGFAGRHSSLPTSSAASPAPFFEPGWRALPDRLGVVLDALEVPAEFQLTGWARIDQALTSGSIWLWLALFGVLALVVTR